MWYNVDMINDSAWQGRPTHAVDRRWSALALIVTAQFMVILDVAIVNVALPAIKSDLEFSETSLQWVISAYAILFGLTYLSYLVAPIVLLLYVSAIVMAQRGRAP